MGAGPTVAAQPSTLDLALFKGVVQPVVLVGTGTMDRTGKIDVNFDGRGSAQRTDPTLAVELPYTDLKPLPVSLPYTAASPMPTQLPYNANAPLAIEITAVKKAGEWDPIRVRVEDALTRAKPGSGER